MLFKLYKWNIKLDIPVGACSGKCQKEKFYFGENITIIFHQQQDGIYNNHSSTSYYIYVSNLHWLFAWISKQWRQIWYLVGSVSHSISQTIRTMGARNIRMKICRNQVLFIKLFCQTESCKWALCQMHCPRRLNYLCASANKNTCIRI